MSQFRAAQKRALIQGYQEAHFDETEGTKKEVKKSNIPVFNVPKTTAPIFKPPPTSSAPLFKPPTTVTFGGKTINTQN